MHGEMVELESTFISVRKKKKQPEWKSRKAALQGHLFNVSLQDVALFLGLLDLLGQLGSNLVQLLLQGLARALQLSQLLHTVLQRR